jgi:predicted amidohydrolase YtcJ
LDVVIEFTFDPGSGSTLYAREERQAMNRQEQADLIITQTRAFTANPQKPWAESVAVRGNRIVFVGATADALAWRGPATRVVDGQGATLLPGLIDSHFHLQWGSTNYEDALLEGLQGFDQLAQALRAQAAKYPDKPWITGHRLAYDVLGSERMLTRHDLDAIEPHRPVALMSFDYHAMWANTRALELGGILHGAPVPHGSEIVMGADGLAAGQLTERDAFRYVLDAMPPLSEAEHDRLLGLALQEAASWGITGVHNMDGDAAQMARYAAREEEGRLSLRVWITYSVKPETPFEALAAEAAVLADRYHMGMVRTGCVKFFMDGVIDSFTGFMLEPYALRPDTCGEVLWSAEKFDRYAIEADRLGLQIVVHAIGDAAIRRTLDGFATARRANGPRDSRHRIEHIELLHPADLPRLRELDVVASMQPLHASRPDRNYFMFWTEIVGRKRWRDAFPWRNVHGIGAPLTFGSDWPIVTMDPYRGLEAVVTRKPWAEGLPNQALDLAHALEGYTRVPAWVEFQEHAKGQLMPGLLADLALLDADLFALTGEDIARVRPVLTVCDGRVVHDRT